MIRDILKALVLGHALPIIGIVFALCVTGYGAYRIDRNHQRSVYFEKGKAYARDSAQEATLRAIRDSNVAHARALHDSARRYTAALDSQAGAFLRQLPQRAPLRIEAIPLPDSLARIPDPVLVTVASTGEHFVLPRAAARYWFVSDSLVAVAAKLLDKYVAANKQWSEAWSAEHSARIASDSLVALLQSRTAPPPAKPSRFAMVFKWGERLGLAYAGYQVGKAMR